LPGLELLVDFLPLLLQTTLVFLLCGRAFAKMTQGLPSQHHSRCRRQTYP
jgi:hypothetical protein